MNILFTCAGRRNYLINYFKKALENQGKVFASDMNLTAPALVDADMAIQVPEIYERDYISTIIGIIKEHNISAVISLNDLELPILSRCKEEIEKIGTRVIISDDNVIKIAFDKWETVKFLNSIGLKSPKTFINLNEAKKAIDEGSLSFPLVIKPRWGSASIGIHFPENLEELDLVYQLQTIQLKKTILAEASNEDIDHAILIQEKIQGTEYGMDILNDFQGNYIGTFVRKKLSMRAGETDKAISVIDERFNQVGKIIGENLKHIGNLDCDVFECDGKLYILELNPRFGGGYPFSHEAGSNTAAAYIEWLKGGNNISQYLDYKEGIMFSKCDRLLRIN
ncbi:ATP-grasp domain-containing protein [Capnocytophaga cynodegmi]|uniref:ATP-grasp fold domain-containing protein n=1 Tax=Capnocytophaga cynodegmi TaxID=28189 RepID=A0A0B7H8G7_9FLAO|nr:ATP-grasp domain-containing protein [Capnocytophaga cynodegmi]CEN35926.1 ATP-grasp fold domain-containing protein [Capnocytophaga cynodegmi]CEN36574.1 ATP-grasp fold domain-containing protein [Capnocytophaga cynodegmi]